LLRRMNVFVTMALAAWPQRCTSDEADTLLSARLWDGTARM
jgi:hypothetical protein